MRSLLVDGEWNLKRNYKKRVDLISDKGEYCGGVFGFLETLGATIDRLMPDRVVVMWDGEMSGKLRHDIYPLYKQNHKDWDPDSYLRTKEQIDAEMRSKVSLSNQKRQTKNLIDGLFIRQAEVDLMEGDDLIALYIITKEPDEEIIIFSRDRDYYQLINEQVSVLKPTGNIIITPNNFKQMFGFPLVNALLLKCIEGDDADNVSGVPGVALKTILKYYPKFADEEYTVDRFIQESFEMYTKKKLKTFESMMGCRKIIERNKILMDLKNPLLTEEAIAEIDIVKNSVMAKENGQFDRSVTDVIKSVIKEGYVKFMFKNDVHTFFAPYQRISIKEKEYAKKILEG